MAIHYSRAPPSRVGGEKARIARRCGQRRCAVTVAVAVKAWLHGWISVAQLYAVADKTQIYLTVAPFSKDMWVIRLQYFEPGWQGQNMIASSPVRLLGVAGPLSPLSNTVDGGVCRSVT